jgi:hypothetical protein
MAGSFTSPSSNSSKMKHGSVKKPRGGQQSTGPLPAKPEHPITDSFAACHIPSFDERHRNTNAKTGFNTTPARPPAGRLAQRAPGQIREAGKEVGRDSRPRDANSHGSGGSQKK